MRRRTKLSEQLRKAVLSAGVSRYRISKETGIPEGNLSRFVHGNAWLSMESLDKLCDYLNLNLTGPKKRPRKPEKGGY